MSKIYFVAINWQEIHSYAAHQDSSLCIRTYDVRNGEDIGGFVEQLPYHLGWRIYPYTRKKDRDALQRNTIGKWMSKKEESK